MGDRDGMKNVIDLRAFRGLRTDVAAVARERFAAARRASGLLQTAFADVLTEILGWPVSAEAIAAWESTKGVPPGDVLLAAELVAQRSHDPDYVIDHLALAADADPQLRLVNSYGEVQAALAAVIDEATEVLATTGSRSRDPDYLARIEAVLTERPSLVHYRVLYGPPRHGALKNHLLRLVDLHRSEGTINIGVFWDLYKDAERFLCVSEHKAVIVLPSLTSVSNFDTALIITDPEVVQGYMGHLRQAYLGSEALTTRAMVEDLEVLR